MVKSLFLGTAKYTETSIDEKIKKYRNDVYFGSAVDFFKGIIDNSWSSKKFILYKGSFSENLDDYFKVLKKEDL